MCGYISHSSPCPLEAGPPTEPGAELAVSKPQHLSNCLCLHSAAIIDTCSHAQAFVWVPGDLNLGPFDFTASVLTVIFIFPATNTLSLKYQCIKPESVDAVQKIVK